MPKQTNGGEGLKWPNGKRIAVMLSFDFDAESLHFSRFNQTPSCSRETISFADYSRGRYGPDEGLRRCLDLLRARQLRATFFVPGYVAETYPDQVREIASAGHELAYHGYLHDTRLGIPEAEELANMEISETLLERLCGRRPCGHRAPGSVMQTYTVEMLAARGYLYSSSLKTCDWAYLHQRNGQKIPLVELPSDYCLDDYTYYFYTLSEPYHRSLYNNRYVREIWRDEFDGLAAEGDKIMCLKLHPELIGRASRIRMLGELVDYMQEQGAWIGACADVAAYVLRENGFSIGEVSL